jgi:hypothetical protein
VDARAESLLAHAADLERRDETLARQAARVGELLVAAERLRTRASEQRSFLASVPAAAAALDVQEVEACASKARSDAELAASEQRLAGVESRRRVSQEERDQAQRELQRAREQVVDAGARVARVARAREELLDAERAARADAEGVAVEAREVSARIEAVPRVSVSGRVAPGTALADVAEWGARARAALLVVRSQLETERERVVSEAASLGSSVLGEELAGATVALVRRRVEQALLS